MTAAGHASLRSKFLLSDSAAGRKEHADNAHGAYGLETVAYMAAAGQQQGWQTGEPDRRDSAKAHGKGWWAGMPWLAAGSRGQGRASLKQQPACSMACLLPAWHRHSVPQW